MLKNESAAQTAPANTCGPAILTFVVNHLAERADTLQQADLDIATPIIAGLAAHVSPAMRLAAAETLRAEGTIPVSVFAGLAVEAPRLSPAKAGSLTSGQLLAMARQPEVTEAVSNLIVARGVAEALVAVAANPGASIAKSSLTTLVELAASDFSLREALCSRGDLPDAILDRLWPFLSPRGKLAVISAGLSLDAAAADSLLKAADQELLATLREGDLPLGLDTCHSHIDNGTWSLADAAKALAAEGRFVDVASLLARRAGLAPGVALALLLGAYDRGCVALARAAGADAAALTVIIDVRAKAGARRTPDRRGPMHALSGMSAGEAADLVGAVRVETPVSDTVDAAIQGADIADIAA